MTENIHVIDPNYFFKKAMGLRFSLESQESCSLVGLPTLCYEEDQGLNPSSYCCN